MTAKQSYTPPAWLPPRLVMLVALAGRGLAAQWTKQVSTLTEELRSLHNRRQLTRSNAWLAISVILLGWPDAVVEQLQPVLLQVLVGSYRAGLADSGVPTAAAQLSLGDRALLDRVVDDLLGTLRNLAISVTQRVGEQLDDTFGQIDPLNNNQVVDVDRFLATVQQTAKQGAGRAVLVLRAESVKAANMAKLAAWAADPRRDWFHYLWSVIHDGREKNVSHVFEEGNPYTFAGIRQTWEEKHTQPQWVKDRQSGNWRWETSQWNCRCSIARAPKDAETLYNEGKLPRATYYAIVGTEAASGSTTTKRSG